MNGEVFTKVNIGDLLGHATKLGHTWNAAHELFEKDKVLPTYGHYELWLSEVEGNDYGWSNETQKIVEDFFKTNAIEKCIIL